MDIDSEVGEGFNDFDVGTSAVLFKGEGYLRVQPLQNYDQQILICPSVDVDQFMQTVDSS